MTVSPVPCRFCYSFHCGYDSSVPLFCLSIYQQIILPLLSFAPQYVTFSVLGPCHLPLSSGQPCYGPHNYCCDFFLLFLSTSPLPSPLKTLYCSTPFSCCKPVSALLFSCSHSHVSSWSFSSSCQGSIFPVLLLGRWLSLPSPFLLSFSVISPNSSSALTVIPGYSSSPHKFLFMSSASNAAYVWTVIFITFSSNYFSCLLRYPGPL